MRYGVINAMQEEKLALLEAMTDMVKVEKGLKEFYTGKIGSTEVVVVESGIGKVEAAITTTLLINEFDVDAVINSGSAGALGADLRIGDIVIADNLAYGDADARAFGYAYGQVPQQPATFVPDEALASAMADEFAKKATGKLYRGLILTSDSFIAGPEQKDVLLGHFPEAMSAEMEGAAIAQVATTYNKPFAVVRAISDNANGEAGPTFDEFIVDAGRQSAEVLIHFFNK
ncbi:5'-methylthioadenosine/adenosylhomocysteine nucleosidase [Weissella tructae]|jgi:adenosylhomocysteine nucleosidase|uniref:adenosylhomocysteine nucleosidase n=2 Tax=Weissella TaxID=46255 RepID=A0A075TUG9_9LACO|nr:MULTISPECIES: 5'-methylthioadenosine/adenosylhomocysteine nucleosidase [Weissella]AIG65204.1 5'-methylthioadenosine/S-adenosylhomocysteine nucleosidase 2 [Weissella tructae]AIM62517.1 5'-methylthioadenosine/S-adenosylhomocysteine nucleosidase 2 [Weissella ceti]AIM63853.1 5'-methylthioadenosine/S-adenosylhomocysteine nucleosidase 2 [Weissella ceti]ELA07604.1 5'-methylthioadenosine nucleosidase / S-adenosylhomocysteine nucleosidase [Weissella ceti NC36]QVV91585.1 5'-methylthioadenosine/adenos